MDKRFTKEALPSDGWINIREIDSEGKATNKYFTKETIVEYMPPKNKNVYYGVYSRAEKKGTAAYCKNTLSIWADYDNMTLEAVKKSIHKQGIPEPSVYVHSGHGIHAYWLLNKPVGIEALPVIKGIVKATEADMRAAECARVMRMPGTVNINGSEPVPCQVIEYTGHRYSLKQLEPFKLDMPISTAGAIPELENSERACISKMAAGVKEGHRNFALGRLTKYLQVKGYTKKATKEIITRWNARNNPPEKLDKLYKDIEAYWHGDYKLLGCMVKNTELQSILSDYCNRAECRLSMTIGRLQLDNTVKYNNRIFNYIHKVTGNDLLVYGVLLRHKEGLRTSNLIQKLTPRKGRCCISKPTQIKSLSALKKYGLIEIIKANKRAGKEDFYKAIPQGTYGTGYTIASNGAINGLIDGRVTPAEFKLYVLLLKYAFQKGSCYPSLDTIAKDLQVDKALISRQLAQLEKVDYIKRNSSYPNGVEKYVFTLLV